MKSLNRAFDLIEHIARKGAIGVRELAAAVDLPPATTHRIVAALVKRGYLNKAADTHRYALSPKFLSLGERARGQIDMVAGARPFLQELVAATRENANLCVRDGDKVIYIDHVASPDHDLQAFTRLGGSAPLYASGVGKVFLSGFDEEKIQSYLARVELKAFTPKTLVTAAALRAEIRRIDRQGYALDDEEKAVGVRCVAAPVHDHRGEIAAAISVSGAAQRLPAQRLPELAVLLMERARRFSAVIGYE